MAKAQTMGMKSSSTHSSIHRNPARLQGPKHASKASKHVSKAFKHAGKVHKSRARPTPKYDGKFEGFDQDDGDYSDDSNNDEAVDDSEAAEDSDDNDASDASNDSNVGGQNAADLYLADEHKSEVSGLSEYDTDDDDDEQTLNDSDKSHCRGAAWTLEELDLMIEVIQGVSHLSSANAVSRTLAKHLQRHFRTTNIEARTYEVLSLRLGAIGFGRCKKEAGGSVRQMKALLVKQMSLWKAKIVANNSLES